VEGFVSSIHPLGEGNHCQPYGVLTAASRRTLPDPQGRLRHSWSGKAPVVGRFSARGWHLR